VRLLTSATGMRSSVALAFQFRSQKPRRNVDSPQIARPSVGVIKLLEDYLCDCRHNYDESATI
jgi:hypothetical protein